MKTSRTTLLIAATILFAVAGAWHFEKAPVYTKEDLMGQFNPEEHPGFERVPNAYASKEKEYLRKEVVAAFIAMAKAAKKDGFDMIIVSGTRNYEYQIGIWNRKWEGFSGSDKKRTQAIMAYSSMPGTSRHHWGTDLDINSVEPAYFESGYGARLYRWLDTHAHEYGFFQPYKDEHKGRPGYKDEKWHWSYYPTSRRLLKAFNFVISQKDIEGFPGAHFFEDFDVQANFINGIVEDPRLQKKTLF
jgi:LAS superfamily LD-carboxypeptidase LdcB